MRLALLMDQGTSYGRAVFAGIRRRLLPRLDCRLLVAEPSVQAWRGLVEGGIDAAIVHAGEADLADAVLSWGGPAVNVSYAIAHRLPRCGVDDRELGRLAAQFLLGRAPACFAFVGRLGRLYSCERLDGFSERLAAAGRSCHSRDWAEDPRGLAQWVAGLPAPAALLVGGDELGLRAVAACHEAGLAVPDRILVLSATNDEITCTLSRPTLSSVVFDAERIGDDAAGLVLRLYAGEAAPAAPILVRPTHVEERASTAIEALPDKAVAAALRWMREHASEAIGVDHVADAVRVGRRSLERRFSAMVGRSVYQHLLAVRLDLAKALLRAGEAPLEEVASRCGFAGARHLCEAFRAREGRTPSSFRSERR